MDLYSSSSLLDCFVHHLLHQTMRSQLTDHSLELLAPFQQLELLEGQACFSRFPDTTSFQTHSEPNSIRNKFIANLYFTYFFCLFYLLRSSIRACMTYIVFQKINQNDLFCFEINLLPHSSFPLSFLILSWDFKVTLPDMASF